MIKYRAKHIFPAQMHFKILKSPFQLNQLTKKDVCYYQVTTLINGYFPHCTIY